MFEDIAWWHKCIRCLYESSIQHEISSHLGTSGTLANSKDKFESLVSKFYKNDMWNISHLAWLAKSLQISMLDIYWFRISLVEQQYVCIKYYLAERIVVYMPFIPLVLGRLLHWGQDQRNFKTKQSYWLQASLWTQGSRVY